MAFTLEQRLSAALVFHGCVEQPRTSRYRKFLLVANNPFNLKEGKFFFVGANGALRYGQNAQVSRSFTGHSMYKALLEPTS